MIKFIVMAIIGWVINLIFGISTMVDGWRNKDKKMFELGISVTVIGLLFGLVTGWVILFQGIKQKYIDKRFDN
jgi:succinate dehydrogenase/fumarate reductase cytochrome b subunit